MKKLLKRLSESTHTQGTGIMKKYDQQSIFKGGHGQATGTSTKETPLPNMPKIVTVTVAPLPERLAEYQKINQLQSKIFFLKMYVDVFRSILNDSSQNAWLLEDTKALQAITIYSPEHYKAMIESSAFRVHPELQNQVENWETKVAAYNPIKIRIK